MIRFVLSLLRSLTMRLTTMVAAFFSGMRYEKNKNVKKENKRLKSNIGLSDSALAKRLRERAANKNKNKR